MITLSEAFKLCGISDGECIKFTKVGEDARWVALNDIWTAGEIRKKLDMKRIHVHRISPWFSFGEYEGWLFTTDGLR